MVANCPQSTRKLINSSKSNPCPVCGRTKDGDCRISHDGGLVLCHNNFDHGKTQQPDRWHFNGETSDNRCGEYLLKEITEKSIRPKAFRTWEYPARDDGSRLVRVVRTDDGEGNKKTWQQHWDENKKDWVTGCGDVARASIPIYRRAEIREAIAKGEPVYIVEGEPCADLLWKLGIAATTNIGGGGKFTLTDSMDLQGAERIVIVPDRDKKGIEHADKLAEYFPHALWLYPFPESKVWANLPKDHGLDIADWIEHHKITADDIKGAIREKKVLQASNRAKTDSIGSNNVVTHPRFAPNPAELKEELTALINTGTAGSELTAAIFSLAKGGNPQPIWRLYKEISEEIEDADQRADRKKEVENLLTIGRRRLTLENYLHPYLAEPIKKVSAWMAIDPEAVLTHLLPIAAGLINPQTRIIAKQCINFSEPCLIYSGVVALSGGRKTPTLNIVKAPLVKLQSIEDARYEQALQRYEAEMQALKGASRTEQSGGDEGPQKPNPPREFYLDNATVEAVDKVKGQQPDHGSTLVKDELSSLFASHGAYKGGKGADKESYLSGWNGGGVKKNRAGDGSRVSLSRDSLSITGGIQPDKLRELLGDFSDSQGEWARFLWYHMPMRPFKIPRDDTSYSLDELLTDIYEKIDALPALKLRFDKQGQTYFDDWHDEKDEQKRAETRPGLQAAIAKMPGQAVRLIGLLHILWEVASGSAEVPEEIPFSIVKSGCKLADFYLGQVTLLQGDGDALNGELTPVLKGLLDKVNERGSLTATEAKKTIWGFRKVEPAKIRQYFNELAGMDLAVVLGSGSRLTLTPKISSVDEHQQLQNPISVRVPDISTSKELRIVDEVLMRYQQPESFIQQGIRDIKYQTVDGVDEISTAEINIQSPKVELKADASKLSADIRDIGINTSISSTDGSQIPAQQECAAVDEILPPASTVEDSSTGSTSELHTAPKPEIKIGDRVVIAWSDNPRYRGVTGEVTDFCFGIRGEKEFCVHFDKKISNILHDYFPATDVMREAPPFLPAPEQVSIALPIPTTQPEQPQPEAEAQVEQPEQPQPEVKAEPIALPEKPQTSEPAEPAPALPPVDVPPEPETTKKPEIKFGDRVVIVRSDNPRYCGVRGRVVGIGRPTGKGLEFCVRFDKKIGKWLAVDFPVADLMREPAVVSDKVAEPILLLEPETAQTAQPTDTSSQPELEAQPEVTEPIALPAETPETALTPEPELAEPAPTPTPEPTPELELGLVEPAPQPELEPIETLNLSCRAYNCLKRAQINIIQQLLTHTSQSLLEIKSLGCQSVDEISSNLQRLGFSLASEVVKDAE